MGLKKFEVLENFCLILLQKSFSTLFLMQIPSPRVQFIVFEAPKIVREWRKEWGVVAV